MTSLVWSETLALNKATNWLRKALKYIRKWQICSGNKGHHSYSEWRLVNRRIVSWPLSLLTTVRWRCHKTECHLQRLHLLVGGCLCPGSHCRVAHFQLGTTAEPWQTWSSVAAGSAGRQHRSDTREEEKASSTLNIVTCWCHKLNDVSVSQKKTQSPAPQQNNWEEWW